MALVYNTPLSAAQQAVEGIDPPQPLALADRVRFSELDALNHVNNAVYMEWFERLRVRYAQNWGMSNYSDHRDRSDEPRIVIAQGTIRYLREMRMDEDYIATCACTAFRTSSYSLAQQVWSGGSLRATFDCVMVQLEPDGSAKRPLSAEICDRFRRVDGARQEG